MRLNEILKENKEFSSTSSLMEHKMNDLTEENGVLSLQVMIQPLDFSKFFIKSRLKAEVCIFADENCIPKVGHLRGRDW